MFPKELPSLPDTGADDSLPPIREERTRLLAQIDTAAGFLRGLEPSREYKDRIEPYIRLLRAHIALLRVDQEQAGWSEICAACGDGCCCHARMTPRDAAQIMLIQLLQEHTDVREAAFANRDRVARCLLLGKNGCALDTHPPVCARYVCNENTGRSLPRGTSELVTSMDDIWMMVDGLIADFMLRNAPLP